MSVSVKGWGIQLLKMILAGCITIIIVNGKPSVPGEKLSRPFGRL